MESSVNRLLVAMTLVFSTCSAGAAISCRLVSFPGIAFGGYDTLSQVPIDTLTNIRVTCERNGGPPNVTLTMTIGPGSNGTSVTGRRMRQLGGSGEYLEYGLYREVTRSSIWGMTAGVDAVTQTLSVPNKGTQSTTFIVYGRIRPLQDLQAGSYGDTVEITLTP
jgi:spore coat protein U-like protein